MRPLQAQNDSLKPTIRILFIIIRLSRRSQLQRVERIHHYRQLLRSINAQALLNCTWMWSVCNTSWVQCEGGAFDAATAAEVAVDVVEHFVAVDVAVVVRDGDRQRVVVELAWHKRADDEVGSLERLMHGWWLMDTTRDRLEVGDVEDPGVLAAVPANDVAGMVVVPVAGESVTDFQAYLEVAALSVCVQFFGSANVALTVG